jgi:hypothetical protein
MKISVFVLFSIWFFNNLYSQKICCEKPEDVWLTLVECSRTSNYDRLRLLIPPNGKASRDVYTNCNPGEEFGGQILSKKQFAEIYINYKNSGFPKCSVEYLDDEKINGRYYKLAKVNGFMYVINYDGCWYWVDS